ncbi:MAG: hypothetical protein J6U54_10950 [Clostridiales bacterium]|nr:hypothetical protein [Clostridiales bacterium]
MKFSKQTMLTVISIAGVAASVAVTAVMAPKAERAIKAKKRELSEIEKDGKVSYSDAKTTLTTADKLELVKTAAPYYIPTALLCIATVGAILMNHHINHKALLGLSATTSYLVANRDQLKKFIDENPKAKKLADEAKAYFLPPKNICQTIEETGNGDLLCFEAYTGRIFRSSEEAVTDAQDKLIAQYLDEEDNGEFGYASYNDYYHYLNICQTQFGHEYGWVNNEDWYYGKEPIGFHNELVAADAPGNDFGEPVYLMMLEDGWQPLWGYAQI